MAGCRHCLSRNNYNLVLNLFIAVVVMATFLMVCYMVYVPYHDYRRAVPGSKGVRLEHRYLDSGAVDEDEADSRLERKGPALGERNHELAEEEHSPEEDPGRYKDVARKRQSHFDSLHEDIKKMILKRIPDLNRTSIKSKKRLSRPLPEPIRFLSTHFSGENCRQPYCSEFLDQEELLKWKECTLEATLNGSLSASTSSSPESTRNACRFAEDQHRKPVALMSLPGSGNTWVRGLLETATGICTGALYCDVSLRSRFTGEQVTSGRALVVKTHVDAPPRKNTKNGIFGSAIVVIRNPFKALVAEWNRKVSNGFRERTTILDSHVRAAGPEWFGRNEKWEEHVEFQMGRWQRIIKQWVLSDLLPVLVVQYEALQEDPTHQVRRMLQFLHVDYSETELEEKLAKGFEMYHRRHHSQGFEHFTEEQKIWVNSMIKDISSLLSFSDKSHLLDLERYLME